MDCTEKSPPFNPFKPEQDDSKREQYNWSAIDQAFSRPIIAHEHFAAYVPTQIIAERFRREGYDGIGYRSALGEGHNIVLFDLDAADLINCLLVVVKNVLFETDIADNPYFIAKYYPNLIMPEKA